MADSRIVKIHKKIAELVSVNFAGGHSGLDFSNRGFRFVQLDNIMIPSVGIKFVDSLEENTNVTLGRYRGTAIFEVYAFCGGTTNEARTDSALNACSDMIKAITANRQLSLGTDVDDVMCDFMSIDGDVLGVDGVGIGYIRVKVFYQSDDGA
tara:strand:- start:46 stop:501 length:456 start_codon:yes stop_codon:yes gene_type:complete